MRNVILSITVQQVQKWHTDHWEYFAIYIIVRLVRNLVMFILSIMFAFSLCMNYLLLDETVSFIIKTFGFVFI